MRLIHKISDFCIKMIFLVTIKMQKKKQVFIHPVKTNSHQVQLVINNTKKVMKKIFRKQLNNIYIYIYIYINIIGGTNQKSFNINYQFVRWNWTYNIT